GTVNTPSLAFCVARYLADGTLDPTFGSAGTAVTAVSGKKFEFAQNLFIAPDGSLVAVGPLYDPGDSEEVVLLPYAASRTPDSSFGVAGVVIQSFEEFDRPVASAMQADGSVVVAVNTFGVGTGAVLARFAPDGTLDPTFGTGGVVTPPFTGYDLQR